MRPIPLNIKSLNKPLQQPADSNPFKSMVQCSALCDTVKFGKKQLRDALLVATAAATLNQGISNNPNAHTATNNDGDTITLCSGKVVESPLGGGGDDEPAPAPTSKGCHAPGVREDDDEDLINNGAGCH